MGRRSRSTLPQRVAQLRGRIERWRRERARRSPMPEPLWRAAVSLARRHGVYPVARALRVDFGTLKKRANALPQAGQDGEISEFVELAPQAPLIGRAHPAGAVVELWGADGARLVLRLPAAEELDVRRLAEAFWSRRA